MSERFSFASNSFGSNNLHSTNSREMQMTQNRIECIEFSYNWIDNYPERIRHRIASSCSAVAHATTVHRYRKLQSIFLWLFSQVYGSWRTWNTLLTVSNEETHAPSHKRTHTPAAIKNLSNHVVVFAKKGNPAQTIKHQLKRGSRDPRPRSNDTHNRQADATRREKRVRRPLSPKALARLLLPNGLAWSLDSRSLQLQRIARNSTAR